MTAPDALPPEIAHAYNAAVALYQQGRFADAEHAARGVLAQAPHHANALHLLGAVLMQSQRFDEAAAVFDRWLGFAPDNADAWTERGNALYAAGRTEDARASYERALSAAPDHVPALSNLGATLSASGRPAEALAAHDRALAVKPDHVPALFNRGNALSTLGRLEDAVASYDRALAFAPDHHDAWLNRGEALRELGRLDDAVASFARAQALRPGDAASQWNLASALLLQGNFARGWPLYEARLRVFPRRGGLSCAQWQGEDIAGKTILLHAEQGYGDAIQFCRYAPMVAARGARVLLEVQSELKSLLGRVEGVSAVYARGEAVPMPDVHCPLMSLPGVFGTSLATIPAHVPYIAADPARIAQWRARLGGGDGLRIGLTWSGNPQLRKDPHRSLPLHALAPLFDAQAQFVSLQKDVRAADAAFLRASARVRDFGAMLRDFEDTAALASLMDVVITVDTATAHLAGALGKPTWILLSAIGLDWRWLLGRADSPWYPTARLFRQPVVGDWEAVIAKLSQALAELQRP